MITAFYNENEIECREWVVGEKKMYPVDLYGECLRKGEDYITMFSTGLTDIKKRKIFFDDLLKINDTLYRVVGMNGAVAFVDPKTGDFWNYACNLATNRYGVIVGNIHENHQLIV